MMRSPRQNSPESMKVQRQPGGRSSPGEGEDSPRPNPKNISSFTSLGRWLLAFTPRCVLSLENGYGMKPDILHDSPDNGQTAHLGGEGINLIGALAHIAE